MSNGFNYRSRVFLALWAVNFLFTFSTNLIPTSRAFLTKLFVGNVEATTMEALGIMISIGSAAATIGYFAGGFAADSFGRRKVVLISFAILTASCALFALAPNLYFLYLASFIEFFAAGFSSPAISALVADCSEQCSRGTAYGIFNLSWVSAGVAGPLLAGFIAQFVYLQVPFLLAALVSVLGLFASFLLKGNNAGKKETIGKNSRKMELNSFEQRAALKRIILIFSVTNILNGLLNGFVNPVLNGMLLFKLGAAPAMYGLVLSLSSSLVTGLVQLPGGKLTDRFGRKPLVLFGFLGVPLILLLGLSRSLLDFSLIMGGISAVGNISSPAISAWLMDLIPEQRRASVSGITQTLNGIGLTAGPNMGSYVWNATKPDAIIPCGISAVIFVASLPFYLMLKEPKKTRSDSEETPAIANA
jgi:DHA1 family multidrug resistance protein-like MFS transporter